MKLKTKIVHSFEIEDNVTNLDFVIESLKTKKKTRIINLKKNKKDVSTGLF
jgi:hypothetical protein